MSRERLYTIEDLEELLDKIPYEIWLKDEEGKHIYVNKLTAKKIGLTKEEIIGKTDYEIRPKELADVCKETDKEVLENRSSIYSENKLFKKEDSICYELFKFLLDKDNGDVFIGGLAREVSANKNMQLEIEKLTLRNFNNNKFDNMGFFDNILTRLTETVKCQNVNMFLFYDDYCKLTLSSSSKGKYENIFENDTVVRMCDGVSNELDVNPKCTLNLVQDKVEKFYKNNIKENSLSKIYGIEFAGKFLGIIHVYYEKQSNYHWRDDEFFNEICSKLSSIVGSMKLITENQEDFNKYILENYVLRDEKKRLEESIELEKMKSNILVNISHEFRTPINIILTSVQLILTLLNNGSLSDEKLKKYLNILKQNSYRLTRLVGNIIDVNKINTGFYELELENHNIINVIEEIVLSTASYVEENGKRIIFDTEEEEVFLDCDTEKIERIILNLISNALKFAEDNGEITVNIGVDNENERVLVHIKNDGPPISKEDGEKIFRRFIQRDDILTRPCEGSGLGLYIVKSLVEMHNGEVWVNTDIDDGAEFIFYIPIINSGDTIKKIEETNNEERRTEKCNIEFSDVYNLQV